MSPELGIILMLNNYFHDVATALLFASGLAMHFMTRPLGAGTEKNVSSYFLSIYASMSRLALVSLAWIVLGGIPRTIYYTRFEWANAAGKGQVPALIVKHVIMFAAVAGGVYVWRGLRRKIRLIRRDMAAS
jgi:hypothetical protein